MLLEMDPAIFFLGGRENWAIGKVTWVAFFLY